MPAKPFTITDARHHFRVGRIEAVLAITTAENSTAPAVCSFRTGLGPWGRLELRDGAWVTVRPFLDAPAVPPPADLTAELRRLDSFVESMRIAARMTVTTIDALRKEG